MMADGWSHNYSDIGSSHDTSLNLFLPYLQFLSRSRLWLLHLIRSESTLDLSRLRPYLNYAELGLVVLDRAGFRAQA